MPEVSKEFPVPNGLSLMSGGSSAPSGSQPSTLDHSGLLSSGVVPSQQHQQAPGGNAAQQIQQQPQQQQTQSGQVPQPLNLSGHQSKGKEKEGEAEPTQLTAIFRPDDAGEWKEKLRLSHEASEQARLERAGQASGALSGAASWERRAREDEEDTKEDEPDVEEEESGEVGEGDGTKVWKAKRTLRKSVSSSLS